MPANMEIHAADINAKVQSEIDQITRRMIDAEERLLAAQNANEDVASLKEEVAGCSLSARRRVKVLYFGQRREPNARQVTSFVRAVKYEQIVS